MMTINDGFSKTTFHQKLVLAAYVGFSEPEWSGFLGYTIWSQRDEEDDDVWYVHYLGVSEVCFM